MAYLALYRQWRPRRLSEVVGQQHIVRTLKNALQGGRLAHAYLFAGPRGTGKTTIAKVLSRAVNCERPDGSEPCNQCATCREILTGNGLDVIELDAASNRGIDEVRALRERAQYAPARCRYKVYIVDEVHMLTQEAFNALLKTLEEPPRHVLFILATTEPHKLPGTILSRCQRFDFHQLSPAEIDRRLRQVTAEAGAEVDDEALALICRYANGAMRDALSLLDQCLSFAEERLRAEDVIDLLGTAPRQAFSALTAAVAGGDAAGVLQRLAGLIDEGRDPAQLARDWVAHARDLLLAASGCDLTRLAGLGPEAAGEMAAESVALGQAGLVRLITILSDAEAQMRWASQPRLILEVAALRLAAERGEPADAGGGETPETAGDRRAPSPADVTAEAVAAEPAGPAADDAGSPPPPPAEPLGAGVGGDVAAPSPAEASAGDGPDLDLEELRRRWPEVLRQVNQRLRRRNIGLLDSEPTDLSDHSLTIRMASSGHRDKLKASRECRRALAGVLQEMYGRAFRFKLSVGALQEEGGSPPSPPAPVPPAAAGDDRPDPPGGRAQLPGEAAPAPAEGDGDDAEGPGDEPRWRQFERALKGRTFGD